MAAVDESNSSLNAQCMEFCQALARQGLAFKFSVTIGSHFTFSLDAKEGKATPATRNKKRSSPSTRRRNAKRREEFLKKKSSSATAAIGMASNQKQVSAFQCDHCDSSFKTKNGLKIHKGKSHKEAATPEALRRQQPKEASLLASPMLDVSREECNLNREEVGEENGEPASPLQPSPSSPPSMLCKQCVEEITGNTWHRLGEPWCEDCVRVYFTGEG